MSRKYNIIDEFLNRAVRGAERQYVYYICTMVKKIDKRVIVNSLCFQLICIINSILKITILSHIYILLTLFVQLNIICMFYIK
jgi:hypothetical protein